MFVTLCSHVHIAVKLVYIYIYSCIVTESINEISFHQDQFLIVWGEVGMDNYFTETLYRRSNPDSVGLLIMHKQSLTSLIFNHQWSHFLGHPNSSYQSCLLCYCVE